MNLYSLDSKILSPLLKRPEEDELLLGSTIERAEPVLLSTLGAEDVINERDLAISSSFIKL